MDMCLLACHFEVMLQCCCGKKKTELELETAVGKKKMMILLFAPTRRKYIRDELLDLSHEHVMSYEKIST